MSTAAQTTPTSRPSNISSPCISYLGSKGFFSSKKLTIIYNHSQPTKSVVTCVYRNYNHRASWRGSTFFLIELNELPRQEIVQPYLFIAWWNWYVMGNKSVSIMSLIVMAICLTLIMLNAILGHEILLIAGLIGFIVSVIIFIQSKYN